ncbi:MAG TPA: 2-oxoacid:ferredoxin oxidoreductase subunit beta [Clostridia bacterium]|nr:2-oxoacid:ferredoxin oxidoreductase subunit beta [Clostridia bacterium]
MQPELKKYFRLQRFPHIWCPGCGNGIVVGALVRAIHELQLDQNQVVVVSGIGCSSRASGYLDFQTVHTTHGRALAFATGIKLAKPHLQVMVLMGDGDAAAIGGNHLIHAARRNIDLTAVIFNNSIYGMTGGQVSPLTPQGKKATTAPYGVVERSFDLAALAQGAGATFVARGTAYHVTQLADLMKKAIRHRGFSLVEAVTQCPVVYGKQNKPADPAKMLLWQKEHAVNVRQAAKMSPEELEGKFLTGVLYQAEAPELTAAYGRLAGQVRDEVE